MHRAIDVSDLPEPMVHAIESLVDTFRRQVQSATASPSPRPIGWLKGQWEVPGSFFEPLPQDLLEAFDGGARE